MNGLRIGAAVAALSLAATGTAAAQTQTVNFAVQAINQFSISGSPSLTVNTATAGSAPTPATDNSSRWAITTNQTNTKVQASINLDMPTGVTLSIQMTAPTGASVPVSPVALSTGAQDVVTAITKLNENSLAVTYTLAATSAANVGSGSRTVTFTVIGGT